MGATKTMLLEELEREQIERERDEDATAEASINTPRWQTHHGDCFKVLRGMADASVDSIVTDPPYGISFMGKRWDYDVPSEEIWRQCLRVLKPGGHLLAFAGTRTQHRMAVRIEDAGFEIRDMIAWVYGSGFPKSLDVSKAIDKAAGAEREVVGPNRFAHLNGKENANCYGKASRPDESAPATVFARQWQGWGTALKPALEPITMARKPLAGTVAENVLEHGTGALNVDGCRIAAGDGYTENAVTQGVNTAQTSYEPRRERRTFEPSQSGRWPANLIHDGSDEVVGLFPQSGGGHWSYKQAKDGGIYKHGLKDMEDAGTDKTTGSAARFFYCAKASKKDRDEGLFGWMEEKIDSGYGGGLGGARPHTREDYKYEGRRKNNRPTVKPAALMRYLCRLVTPPGGAVLDPFMGSGSTGKAAVLEGFQFIGIEREAEYVEIAKARIAAAEAERGQMLPLEGEVA
jgi:site-specific DNA-methyltransferase (adenine-specific)